MQKLTLCRYSTKSHLRSQELKSRDKEDKSRDVTDLTDKSSTFHCSYLLSLQSQFNKDLLQFLVDKVDTELLETISLPVGDTIQSISHYYNSKSCCAVPSLKLPSVVLVAAYKYYGTVRCKGTDLEYLKTINVKHSDAEFFMWLLDGFIYGLEKTDREI